MIWQELRRKVISKKRTVFIYILMLVCLSLLCGCEQTVDFEKKILVSLIETEDFTVVENGVRILPGHSASFSIHMTSGKELVSTSYEGESYIYKRGDTTILELRNVTYPTQIALGVSSNVRSITYDPNGGEGSEVLYTYDVSFHLRPNTEAGVDLFYRDGYTLHSWNTAPDGSGERIGLGSRVTVPEEGLYLYAQWAAWTEEDAFLYSQSDKSAVITGYIGSDRQVIVPETIGGLVVSAIAENAFRQTDLDFVMLPATLLHIRKDAFFSSSIKELLFFDNIEEISDAAFTNCTELKTVYINAVEEPYGYLFRRESMYADKIDLLITSQGSKKLICYAGCSMWYNLDGTIMQSAFPDYRVINVAINGTINASIQMDILCAFAEEGDILLHAPEITSPDQLLFDASMTNNDDKFWSGLENNYDLLTYADLRGIVGIFDSLQYYLDKKTDAPKSDHDQQFKDVKGRIYMDATGSIPFERTAPESDLAERETVAIDPEFLHKNDFSLLSSYYRKLAEKGVYLYISYACTDIDAVSEGQKRLENIREFQLSFEHIIDQMNQQKEGSPAPVLISNIWDYLFSESDFYDSVYHLLSDAATRNTYTWIHDIKEQMKKDGLSE